MAATEPDPSAERDRKVRRVLAIEALANLAVLVAKAVVGASTGAIAVLGDAVHSLADLANNGVALVATRLASEPPDRDHPYGHRKFETLAVFALAVLLAVLALELALGAIRRGDQPVVRHGWGLAVMLGVLGVNILLSTWQSGWARRLDSDILRADARHTFSDVLTTAVVIAGWQFAAMGHVWLDRVFALGVAGLILYLAYGLFQRAVPVLVDQSLEDPSALAAVVQGVPGVREARRIRSLGSGEGARIDVVVTVDPALSTSASHGISEEIERRLREVFSAGDVTVHVEPESQGAPPSGRGMH